MHDDTVTLHAVSKQYGPAFAVRGVSFALHPGECIALVGHNGAGKSTLIKLMLGLIRPSAGTVAVLGEDPAAGGAVRVRREVGFLPENVAFQPAMTGREVLAFYARLKREPVAANSALLERVDLLEASQRRVGTYSKGMRQRLGLAQALLGRPRLLLLDEPTTGLDPALRQHFYDIVEGLRQEGATVLLSSHALTELEGRTDRVLVMNRGVLVAAGTLTELRTLAALPIRIRFHINEMAIETLPRILGDLGACRRLTAGFVEVTCADTHRMDVLHRLLAQPATINDLEILAPTLDELYAHFLRQEKAA